MRRSTHTHAAVSATEVSLLRRSSCVERLAVISTTGQAVRSFKEVTQKIDGKPTHPWHILGPKNAAGGDKNSIYLKEI